MLQSQVSLSLLSSSNPFSRILLYRNRWKVGPNNKGEDMILQPLTNISSLLFCIVERRQDRFFSIYLYRPALLNSDNPRRRRCKSLYGTPRFTIYPCRIPASFLSFDF